MDIRKYTPPHSEFKKSSSNDDGAAIFTSSWHRFKRIEREPRNDPAGKGTSHQTWRPVFNPRNHLVGGEACKLSSDLHISTCTHPHSPTQNKVKMNLKKQERVERSRAWGYTPVIPALGGTGRRIRNSRSSSTTQLKKTKGENKISGRGEPRPQCRERVMST